MIIKQMTISPH